MNMNEYILNGFYNEMEKIAVLVRLHHPKRNRKEYAIIGSHGKALKYFGVVRPTKEQVLKEERRINYFKHRRG